MDETAKEIIAMLNILKENSYSGNPQVARDFTIIKDCKKESFDFVIEKAIASTIGLKSETIAAWLAALYTIRKERGA